MNDLLDRIYFGNTVLVWSTSLLVLIVSYFLILIFKRVIIQRLKGWSAKTANTIDDFLIKIIEKSIVPLLYLTAVYFSLNMLQFPASIHKVFHVAFLLAFTFFVLGIITAVIKQFIFSFIQTKDNSETKEKQARGLVIIINIIIWILGVVFLIDNLGYDVTTLITGLGIGGIAIALAAQTILGDLFSYFIIFFDRPFEIGDFIIVDDKMGTVEYIGIKTTRLRTLSGEQLICSNTNLTNSRVHNFKRMQERRIVFKLGVVYQTSYDQLKKIPMIVNEIIAAKKQVRFDRGHFSGFGDFSLDFEFVYYVLSADYNTYMDVQEEIYLEIFSAFEDQKIEFAYPSQTVFFNPASTEIRDKFATNPYEG